MVLLPQYIILTILMVGLQRRYLLDWIPSLHILDLVLSNSQCDIAGTVVSDLLSDHHAVHFSLGIEKPAPTRQVRLYRKIRSIDQAAFNSDIQASDLIRSLASTLAKLVDQYNSTLSELVGRHVPLKRSVLTERPDISWMNEDIIAGRKKRRQCECRWQQTRLTVHLDAFRAERDRVKDNQAGQGTDLCRQNPTVISPQGDVSCCEQSFRPGKDFRPSRP